MMKKVLTVKEFDYIVPKTIADQLSVGTNKVHIIDDALYEELRDYLEMSVSDDGKQLFQIVGKSSSRHRKGIQLKNYVGMIELPRSGFQIEILPKIYEGSAEISDENTIKYILLKMLSSLKDFPSLKGGNASLDLHNLTLYEVFIRIYAERVLELIKAGLRSDYVEVEENLTHYRGKLSIPLHIKYNAAHGERFYVRYDEYSLSRPENKIIKAALHKLFKSTNDSENASLLRRALLFFDEVTDTVDYEADYRRVTFDASNQGYLGVIQWSMVFLRNKSFSIFGGGTKGQSLLFPMDRIFEQYIASQIKRLIKLHNRKYGTNCRVITQESKKYLFDIPKSFKIRPDIKIDQGETILFDTKWKILTDRVSNNNISQADMYQMYAYSKRYHASKVFLLYPETPMSLHIRNKLYIAKDNPIETRIALEFLNLKNIADLDQKGIIDTNNALYKFLLNVLTTESGVTQNLATIPSTSVANL